MTEEEIKKLVSAYIMQADSAGVDIETNKFDFKYEWYNLKDEDGVNEFLKDATAIINSYGGTDGLIVIGFHPTRKFRDASFTHSGLADKSHLANLVTSRVDRPFNVDVFEHSHQGHSVSIIHLPPSLDKPHVIRKYQPDKARPDRSFENEIFVRHSSGAKRAKKYDLDLMYAEKRSIIVDRQVNANFSIGHLNFMADNESRISVRLVANIILENVGMRPIGVIKVVIPVALMDEGKLLKKLLFECDYALSNMKNFATEEFWRLDRAFVANIHPLHVDKVLEVLQGYKSDRRYVEVLPIEITVVSGEVFPCKMHVYEYK